ncbi:MAG: SufE family protein [Bacteroidales bacterium]|nr:SufE family protein [Bacteroidales bacterium]MBN2756091.1 SufE family protein [Bacteroidales bacterium]
MTLQEIQDQIIEEFAIFNEWMDKYEYLIELGKDLKIIDTKFKTNEYLINGCQSKVWLHAELNDDKVIFSADSDAIITKGIVALIIRVLSKREPKEIMNADLYFINEIGLSDNLSPTRANGLSAMIKQMKMYGMAYNAKLGNK